MFYLMMHCAHIYLWLYGNGAERIQFSLCNLYNLLFKFMLLQSKFKNNCLKMTNFEFPVLSNPSFKTKFRPVCE